MLKDIRKNPILLTDTYNLSHQRMKVNTDWECSHMYNRVKPMLLFGLLENITSILLTKINMKMVDEAEENAKRMNLVFPRELWKGVVTDCNGFLPLEIQAIPEGTWSPVGTPFAQIRNTVEGFGEMVTWHEALFMQSYFPSTTATQAFRMRKYLEQKKRQYGYDDSFFYHFHSFGFRGHKSLEDAYWAGISWNLFMNGTDDYHTTAHTPSANISSISALAHKVTQQFDNEIDGYKHAIKATADAGEKIVAIVIDTYDSYRFLNEYLIPLAKYADELGVHIVLRPDSGDTWEQVTIAYKIVSRHYMPITNVSTIIGESMDFENAKKADVYFEQHGVPLNFVSYGIGGGFYNYINRDTLGWAMKTAYSNGKDRMKFSEDPIKRSIPSIVGIYRNEYGDMVVDKEKSILPERNLYKTIYRQSTGIPAYIEYNDAHWQSVRETALAQNTEQSTIYLSDDIRNEIGEFQLRYRSAVK
jgi:nicotinamide phosphoribosyltransferase